MGNEPRKSLCAGDAPAPGPLRGGAAPGDPRPPVVPTKKPAPVKVPEEQPPIRRVA
jgi:hypothetical protein